MPFDSAGQFTRIRDWTEDRDANVTIQASRMDEDSDDFAAALNQLMLLTGVKPMTGNLNMGQQNVTNLASGSVSAPALRFGADTDTGVFLGGTGVLGLTAGGVARLTASTSGVNVPNALSVTGDTTLANVSAAIGTFDSLVLTGGGSIWTDANDGPGSGLNADLLDGLEASHFLAASDYTASDVFAKVLAQDGPGSGLNADLWDGQQFADYLDQDVKTTSTVSFPATKLTSTTNATLTSTAHALQIGSSTSQNLAMSTNRIQSRNNGANSVLNLNPEGGGVTVAGNNVWHSGNDGPGSGLNADLLDGQHASVFVTASEYTANDVLAKLLTVDGSGSGIDADLLDGQHASNFVTVSQYTATDVRAKLLTVDGAGSGIDADLLDGFQASAFARLNQSVTFSAVSDASGNLRSFQQTNSFSGTIGTGAKGNLLVMSGNVTVPSGVFDQGDVVTLHNSSDSPRTITQGGGLTLRQSGTTNTGSLTIAPRGLATLVFVGATICVAAGNVS